MTFLRNVGNVCFFGYQYWFIFQAIGHCKRSLCRVEHVEYNIQNFICVIAHRGNFLELFNKHAFFENKLSKNA